MRGRSGRGASIGRAGALAAALLVLLGAGCGKATRVAAVAPGCTGCHGAPPGGAHPQVSSVLRFCSGCHPGTIDATGAIVAGGLHRDGTVEYTFRGHPAGFASPADHGREFFAAIADAGAGGVPACVACHGEDYGNPVAAGRSCNGCHAAAGWGAAGAPGWQTNCSFCHGARTPATQAGYAVSDHPAWAAPPDAVSERLAGTPAPERTGAHAVHLAGSVYAGPVPCGACHAVPTSLRHVRGRDARAAVALTAPGQAALPDPDGFDTVARTCATACHGAGRSPAWTFTGIACDGCHGIPPATAEHGGVAANDRTACARCHPDTVTAGGTIDVAGGRHVNGTVDAFRHATGFAAPAVHGPQFLSRLAGAPGALDCQGCHGADYGAPIASGDSCNSCHAAAGWKTGSTPNWQTNCSFCHGARNATTQAGYALAANPTFAAPPDAVSQRLTGTAAPTRTGGHQVHLTGKTGAGGSYPPFACAGCHPVPTTMAHVSVGRQATVAFDPAQLFTGLTTAQLDALPKPLAVYDTSGATPTCRNNYCHGSTMSGQIRTAAQYPPQWSTSAPAIGAGAMPGWYATGDCSVCHGYPPSSGHHGDHYGEATCDDCHYAAKHVSGKPDVRVAPARQQTFTGGWNPTTQSCTSDCHDASYRW